MKKTRIPKQPNLLAIVRGCIDSDCFLDTCHATDRASEREISRPEIIHVLKTGRHEKRKDQYHEHYKAWNYSIRGFTVDRRDIRVIVSFEETTLLIITAIELSAKHEEKN